VRALGIFLAVCLGVLALGSFQGSYAGVKRRIFGPMCAEGLSKVSVGPASPGDAHHACMRIASEAGRPVIVNLHQWSADFTEINASVLKYAISNDLNLIIPNLYGPNNSPQACGSDDVMSDVDAAIDFVEIAGKSQGAKVVMIGVSGGGYTALNHVYRGKRRADYYSIWVPITDLGSWHRQSVSRGLKYADDIKKCTGLDTAEMRKRSPLTYASSMEMPETPILLAAGARDGHGPFAVPITHTLNIFDVWATKTGAEAISAEERSNLLTLNYDQPDITDPAKALLLGRAGNAQLLIFDGGHEMLEDFALSEVSNFLEPPAS
jgi:pimeloyl-ACP methyl ester carboxylesterase